MVSLINILSYLIDVLGFDSMYLVYIDPYTWYFNQQTKYMKICDFGMP